MITNIIKEAIKNFPHVANKSVVPLYHSEFTHEFALTTKEHDVVVVVNGASPKDAHSVEEWKALQIAELLFTAAYGKPDKPGFITFQQLADEIDKIINQNVVLWNVGLDTEKPILEFSDED